MNAITIDICEIDDKGIVSKYGFLPNQYEDLLKYNYTKADAGGQYLLITGPHFKELDECPVIIETSTPSKGPLSAKVFPELFSALNPGTDLTENKQIYLNYEDGIYSYAKEDESSHEVVWAPFARAYQYTKQAASNKLMVTPMAGGKVSVSRTNGVLEMSALDCSDAYKPIFSKPIRLTLLVQDSKGDLNGITVAEGDVYNIYKYDTTKYKQNWDWDGDKTPLSYDTESGEIVLYTYSDSDNLLEYSSEPSYQVKIYRNRYTITCTLIVTPITIFGGIDDLTIPDGWVLDESKTNISINAVTYTFTHEDYYDRLLTFEAPQVNNNYYTVNMPLVTGKVGKDDLTAEMSLIESTRTDTINYKLLVYNSNKKEFDIANGVIKPQYTVSGTATDEFKPLSGSYCYTANIAPAGYEVVGTGSGSWRLDDSSYFTLSFDNNGLNISRYDSYNRTQITNYLDREVYVYNETSRTVTSIEQSISTIGPGRVTEIVEVSGDDILYDKTYQIVYSSVNRSYYALPGTIAKFTSFITNLVDIIPQDNIYVGTYYRTYKLPDLYDPSIVLKIEGNSNNSITITCTYPWNETGTIYNGGKLVLGKYDATYSNYRVCLQGDKLEFQKAAISLKGTGSYTDISCTEISFRNKIHTIQSLVGAPVKSS